MSGYPMISSHITNKEVSKKKLWYPMNYMVTTVSHQLYYTWQIIYIYVIYMSTHLRLFRIMYYIRSAHPAMRSYHNLLLFILSQKMIWNTLHLQVSLQIHVQCVSLYAMRNCGDIAAKTRRVVCVMRVTENSLHSAN